MTSTENSLALRLIKEDFGDFAHNIAAHLTQKNVYPFCPIAEDLNLDKKRVAQVLSILVTHGLVDYQLNHKQMIEYKLNTSKAIDRLKIARFVNLIRKTLNDKNVEMIVKELHAHSYLEMSTILLKILKSRFNEHDLKSKSNDQNAIFQTYTVVRESFVKLVDLKLIERVPLLDDSEDMDEFKKLPKVPRFKAYVEHEATKYIIPELDIKVQQMKKAIDEENSVKSTTARNPVENFGDTEIFWKINNKRIVQYFRDQALVDALENRIDKNASNILRVILELADAQIMDKPAQNSFQSKPVTAIDIQRLMRTNHKMDSMIVDKYLNVILQDSFKVLEKIGDFSGGAYCIDFKKALTNLCLAHIESYVREKYDSKSLRIFRVILEKSKLEQKQIEDFSMIPSKECKALVYNMLNDGLLAITELSKTSDHAPSRTYYLFSIDVFQIARKLLENSYKGMKNLMIKREKLMIENKRLLEKSRKINARVQSLIAQGADQAEIEYEKSIMSLEEVNKLESFTRYCNKIELAEIQLEETIFNFENYFYYHLVPPVIPAKK